MLIQIERDKNRHWYNKKKWKLQNNLEVFTLIRDRDRSRTSLSAIVLVLVAVQFPMEHSFYVIEPLE